MDAVRLLEALVALAELVERVERLAGQLRDSLEAAHAGGASDVVRPTEAAQADGPDGVGPGRTPAGPTARSGAGGDSGPVS